MKTKKIISLILAIVLCLTVTIVVVTATTKTANIEITTDKTELIAGETATVSVKVTTNFPVATMSIPVFYDKTMVSVSDATATLTDYAVKNTTTDSQSVDSSKIYANTDVSEDTYGFVLVNYIASANSKVAETIDGVVLTFTITAKSDVEGDALINCVSQSAKTSNNVAGMLYFGSPVSGTTIDSIPDNVENIDLTAATQTVNIIKKSATPNTLVLKDGAPYEAVIDTTNCGDYTGSVYGFDTLGWNDDFTVGGTIADFVTTAYGDDYLEIVVGDAGVETTGTIINVLDADGNVVESYVYIYFGDINMDGLVDSADAYMAEIYESTYDAEVSGIVTLDQFMAADLDGDCWPSSADGYICEMYESTYEGMPFQVDVGMNIIDNGLVYEMV